MHVNHEWSAYTIILYLYRFNSILWLSYFYCMKYVDRFNYVDWLRNLQVRFISEKNSDVLDIPNLEMVSNNEKAMISIWISSVHFMINLDIRGIIVRIILQDWSRVQVQHQKMCIWYRPIFYWVAQTLILRYWIPSVDHIFIIYYSDYRILKVWKEVTLSIMV